MAHIELHRGPYWASTEFEHWMPEGIPIGMMSSPSVREEVEAEILRRFHETVKQNGSRAVWLSKDGCLITTDGAEPDRKLRYYLWRKQAINATIANWKKTQAEEHNSNQDSPAGAFNER